MVARERTPVRLSGLLDKLREHSNTFAAYQDRQLFTRSFSELHRDVTRAVDKLRGAGVEGGMRVGIRATNSYEWVVYDLALVHLGVTIVALPEEETLQDAEALRARYGLALLLVDRPREERWIGRIDGLGELEARALPDAPRSEPDVLSWVFSSGSTGTLKCMSLSRSRLEADLTHIPSYMDLRRDDWILLFLPLSHFQQRWFIYALIWYGANIALATPPLFLRALRETRPTILFAPPLFFNSVARSLRFDGLKGVAVQAGLRRLEAMPEGPLKRSAQALASLPLRRAMGGRLRRFYTGMAPSRASTMRLFQTLGLPIHEAYGMSETGLLAANPPGAPRLGSVGRPIVGDLHLAEDGEIMVPRERSFTTGYVFADEAQQRRTYLEDWVATGDIGRFDEDGFLYLVGRKKEMIVTAGGDKLHPEVLERRLGDVTGVRQSVVFDAGEAQLVAVLSVEDEALEMKEQVRRCVASLNRERPVPLQIGRVVYTTTEFNLENGLLNRSLKLDRRAIQERFAPPLR